MLLVSVLSVFSVCKETKCEDCTDTETCCEPLAECTVMTCPSGYIIRDPVPENATGVGTTRKIPIDDETCCELLGECSTMDCPEGYFMTDPMPKIEGLPRIYSDWCVETTRNINVPDEDDYTSE